MGVCFKQVDGSRPTTFRGGTVESSMSIFLTDNEHFSGMHTPPYQPSLERNQRQPQNTAVPHPLNTHNVPITKILQRRGIFKCAAFPFLGIKTRYSDRNITSKSPGLPPEEHASLPCPFPAFLSIALFPGHFPPILHCRNPRFSV